jgi:hypothetical protein
VTEPHFSAGGSRRYGGPNGYGHAPSPNAETPPDFSHHPAAHASADLPSTVDLSDAAPPVMDQSQTGSCVGHSTSGAVACSLAAQGTPLGWVPSPDDAYKLSRAVDRGLSYPTGTLPKLTDDGTDPQICASAIARFGIRPMRSPTSDGRVSDVEIAHVNDEPDFASLLKDARSLVVGIHRINATGAGRVLAFRQALAAGCPVRFAIDVDESFEAYDGSAPCSAPGASLGGHALYAIGYRTTADGRTIGKGRNSWGEGWGLGGDFEFDESFIAAMSELDVVSARVSP